MKKLVLALAAFSLLLAACGGGSGAQVASLEDISGADQVADDVSDDASDEAAILEFSQCMRDNGIENFEDPDIDADGGITFSIREQAQASSIDREELQGAFEACQEHIEGLSFGPGNGDRSAIEDTLYEFAVCMRENGVDMPDPDFSALGQGGGGNAGPFGELDVDDPAVQEALEECQDIFSGGFRIGGRPGGQG